MNLFVPDLCPQGEERLQVIWETDAVRLERIVSNGYASPDGFWYDQQEDEWVTVLQGEGEIQYPDGKTVRLLSGDTLLIPAGQRHRVSDTSVQPPCIWLCVFDKKEEHL